MNNHQHNETIKKIINELDMPEDNNTDPMETHLHTSLNSFEEMEFPTELHGRIMRTLYLRQFRTPLLIINTILGVNFVLASYEFWRVAGPTVSALWKDGTMHMGTITSSLVSVVQSISFGTNAMFAASLLMFAAGIAFFVKLNQVLAAPKGTAQTSK